MARIEFATTESVAPRFLADDRGRDQMVPGGLPVDPAAVVPGDAVRVTTTGAAAGATTIPLSVALAGPIPAGALLVFGAGLFARTTADAAAGATTLAVEPLAALLANGATANYSPSGTINLVAGQLLGATFAEIEAGTALGAAVDAD